MVKHHPKVTYIGVACGIALCIALVLAVIYKTRLEDRMEDVPDFTSYEVGSDRKHAFIDYLLPYVQEVTLESKTDKEQLETLYARFLQGQELTRSEKRWLLMQAKVHRLDVGEVLDMQFFFDLRRKLDVVPPSLIIAQAAIETGWGTSRFFEQGLSLFGQQCYAKGCGIVPKSRAQGAKHEVMRFNTPKEAIKAYLMNLNAHATYAKLRYLRQHKRMFGKSLHGVDLVGGLDEYSEIGAEYGKRITQVITHNDLAKYDQMIEDVRLTIMEKGYY